MANTFASGRYAKGICDICGFKAMLSDLKEPYVRGHRTGSLVCWTCLDVDHPQNFQGLRAVEDPQALRKSRPDVPETSVPAYTPTFIG